MLALAPEVSAACSSNLCLHEYPEEIAEILLDSLQPIVVLFHNNWHL